MEEDKVERAEGGKQRIAGIRHLNIFPFSLVPVTTVARETTCTALSVFVVGPCALLAGRVFEPRVRLPTAQTTRSGLVCWL